VKQPTEIVYVTWVDSFSEHGWQRKLPPEEDSLGTVSVGWLIEESERSIAISSSYGCRVPEGEDFSLDSPLRIPKAAILRMERR